MKNVTAAQIASIVNGQLVGNDVLVGPSVVLDSREADRGALFIAIIGDRVDGHDYVTDAASRGATAALVSRVVEAPVAQILVDDVPAALTQLGRYCVSVGLAHGMTVLAMTGSSGKTTTKDMLAQVLEPVGVTAAASGSRNSKLGLPITATLVDDSTQFLVAEMGASKIGHIQWLCSIAPPTVSGVLNVGHAHLGEFGSQAAIAQAKGEIVEALPPSGWAVLNAEDPLVAAMTSRTTANIAWFCPSGQPPAGGDCWVGARQVIVDATDRASFQLVGHMPVGEFCHSVSLHTMGAHQVANACAAAAFAACAGASPQQIADGLNSATVRSHWRMEPHRLVGGALLLNDAYNANPDSVAMALDSMARLTNARPGASAVAVLADMLELGSAAPGAHETIGRQAALAGADVVAVGEFAAQIVDGARRAGGTGQALARADVADWLLHHSYDVILIKGSRGIGMETVVNQVIEAVGEEAQ